MTIVQFVLLGAALFSIGLYGVLTRKNAILVLASVEVMLAAVNVNLVAFSVYRTTPSIDGAVYAVFVIMLAAAEAAVALAIVLHVFHHAASISTDDYTEMSG